MSTVVLIENFVENVRAECRERKISQRKLAKMTGIHYVTINRILSGTVAPGVDTCEIIATGLGMNPERIFLSPDQNVANGR